MLQCAMSCKLKPGTLAHKFYRCGSTASLRVANTRFTYHSLRTPPEMDQIGEEFQLRCGTRSARMGAETFSALLTELGYSGECQRCFRSAVH